MTLHCVYTVANATTRQALQNTAADTDVVLLLGGAVTLATAQHPALEQWLGMKLRLYALAEDIAAHGVAATHTAVEVVGYAGWVSLSEQHRTQQVWR